MSPSVYKQSAGGKSCKLIGNCPHISKSLPAFVCPDVGWIGQAAPVTVRLSLASYSPL